MSLLLCHTSQNLIWFFYLNIAINPIQSCFQKNCLCLVIIRLWGLHMFIKKCQMHQKIQSNWIKIELPFIYSCIKMIEQNQDFWIWMIFLQFYLTIEALKIQIKIFLLAHWSILAIYLLYLIENSLYIIIDDTQRHLWTKRQTKQARKRYICHLTTFLMQNCPNWKKIYKRTLIKFTYFEKATKFCENSTVHLTATT